MQSPLSYLFVSFILGVISLSVVTASRSFPASIYFFVLMALLFLLGYLFFTKRHKRAYLPVMMALFFVLGMSRYAGHYERAGNDISGFTRKEKTGCIVTGTVVSIPVYRKTFGRKRCSFALRTDGILMGRSERRVSGKIKVSMNARGKRPEIGDIVALEGEIRSPREAHNPFEEDYSVYLKAKKIEAVMRAGNILYLGAEKGWFLRLRRSAERLRRELTDCVNADIHGRANSLLKAVLLGDRSDVPEDMNDTFRRTGTMHIMAISGLHIGILMVITLFFLKFLRLPDNISCFLTIIFISVYALFAGARPSLVRAAIMGVFFLAGRIMSREPGTVYTLLFSAFAILFFDPGEIRDPGFVLSYSAVVSIISIAPLAETALFSVPGKKKDRVYSRRGYHVLKMLMVSFAVWIGILPLTARYFGIITPFIPLTNFIAIPFLFVMIIFGICFFAVCRLMVLKGLAVMLGKAVGILTGLFLRSMAVIMKCPFSFVEIARPSVWLIVPYYAALMTAVIISRRSRKLAPLLMFMLFAFGIFVWNEVTVKDRGVFKAVFFDAGKADASILKEGNGDVFIVDGGSGSAHGKDTGKSILSPYMRQQGIRRIDAVILSHPHEDHIGGLLYVVKHFKVGSIITADWEKMSKNGSFDKETGSMGLFRELVLLAKKRGIRMVYVKKGDKVKIGGKLILNILNPDPEKIYDSMNEASVTVRMSGPDRPDILFCGDIQGSAVRDVLLFGDQIKSDYVKFPHHGMSMGEKGLVRLFLERTSAGEYIIPNKDASALNPVVKSCINEFKVPYVITGASGAVMISKEDRNIGKTCHTPSKI